MEAGGNSWLEVLEWNHVGGEQIASDFSSRCLEMALTLRTVSAGDGNLTVMEAEVNVDALTMLGGGGVGHV